MVRRGIAGILGALIGVLPLALVDVLVAAVATLDTAGTTIRWIAQYGSLLGALALVGGVVLGGSLAGWMGGRQAGMGSGAVAGVIAAFVYAVSVILLVVGGAKQGWGPTIVALHPIRASAVIVFIALLLLGVSLIAARMAGRRLARGRQTISSRGYPARQAGYGERQQMGSQSAPSWGSAQSPGWSRPPYNSRPVADATARPTRNYPAPPRNRQ